jgi:hypothetical protein
MAKQEEEKNTIKNNISMLRRMWCVQEREGNLNYTNCRVECSEREKKS